MTTREEVEAVNESFSRALARADVDGLLALYTDDARLLLSGQPLVRGREQLAALFREWFEDGPVSIRYEAGEIFEGGLLVVDVGRYITKSGTGKYVVVYERQTDGSLKLAVDAANGDLPRPV